MNEQLKKTIELMNKPKSVHPASGGDGLIKVNESLGKAAFFYEKLRNAIDYQDEHLFLKNAIKRILKRRKYIDRSNVARKLLHELVWARYFENETVPLSYIDEVDQILKKYDYIKQNTRSTQGSVKSENLLFNLAACEIEEFLSPSKAKQSFFRFTYDLIKKNIIIKPEEISQKDIDFQLIISIEKLVFKADLDQLRFCLLKYFIKGWPNISKEQALYLAKNFDKVFSQIDQLLSKNKSSKIFRYVKKIIPSFIVIWDIINNEPVSSSVAFTDPEITRQKVSDRITKKYKLLQQKIIRAITRGIIFVLFTKTVLAFLVEIPYEINVLGEINYPALITNILLPPTLMMIAGFFIKTPGIKNTQMLAKMVNQAVYDHLPPGKPMTTLKNIRTKNYLIFNFFYSVLSLAVLAGVVILLANLDFNTVSIGLFFVFVSLVSFLSFRIRAKAKEFEVKADEDSLFFGLFNFLLLPFVIIGKFLSDKWSDYNFTLFFWDFIIEAPFKTIMSVFEAWLSFNREKREDFE